MKTLLRVLLLGVVWGVFYNGPVFAQARSFFLGRTVSDRVYIRAGQNVNYETLAVVNKGTDLVVLSGSYGWYRVKLPAQAKVYVKADYIRELAKGIAEISADRVNVRCAPDTNATSVGKLEQGRKIVVLSTVNGWSEIRPVDELAGWVKQEFVQPVVGAKVPDRVYAEPIVPSVALVQSSEGPKRPAFIRDSADGLVEAEGVLSKEENLFVLKLGVDNICVIDGPASALAPFSAGRVRVSGKAVAPKGAAGVDGRWIIKLVKIRFVL